MRRRTAAKLQLGREPEKIQVKYNSSRAADDFRRRAQLAQALYRKNCERLATQDIALLANDEIVAHWSVCEYLARSPYVRSRKLLLSELRRMRACGHPEDRLALVFQQDQFDAARDKLLTALIDGYLAQEEGLEWLDIRPPTLQRKA
jgi:hypothetical protein